MQTHRSHHTFASQPLKNATLAAALTFLGPVNPASAQTIDEAKTFLAENLSACPERGDFSRAVASISSSHILTIQSYRGATLGVRTEIDLAKVEISSGYADRVAPEVFRFRCTEANCIIRNGESTSYNNYSCATSAIGARVYKALRFYVDNVPKKKSSF